MHFWDFGMERAFIFLDMDIFNRARLLLGEESMNRMGDVRVIVFGVGGVGSWCVESLVRTGVRHVTIVDCDRVAESNINRQLMADTGTVGEVKVEAMKRHLLAVNPEADIDARCEVFNADTAESFGLGSYDYIIDCIDSLKDKQLLIEMATRTKARFYSSMGAALKMDPTRVKVAEFWDVKGCPLARALRQRFKKSQQFPKRKFKCVYSDELLENAGHDSSTEQELQSQTGHIRKAQINGSLMHITAIFGLTIAGLVVSDICGR